MDDQNSVLSIKDFGRVRLRIDELLEQKGMNRNQLSNKANFRFEVATKWKNGDIQKMDLQVLAKICYVLDCTPGDILIYEKPNN